MLVGALPLHQRARDVTPLPWCSPDFICVLNVCRANNISKYVNQRRPPQVFLNWQINKVSNPQTSETERCLLYRCGVGGIYLNKILILFLSVLPRPSPPLHPKLHLVILQYTLQIQYWYLCPSSLTGSLSLGPSPWRWEPVPQIQSLGNRQHQHHHHHRQ